MKESTIYSGGFIATKESISVYSPSSGELVFKVGKALPEDVRVAIQKGKESLNELKKLQSFERYQILSFIASQLEKRSDEFAQTITMESGKPMRYSRGEVTRAIQTFTIASEESKRLPSELLALDWSEPGRNKDGLVKYFPIGLVAGICPFNFPLNLVAHKVAPAIAAGCPIIIKPASSTPITALKLAEIISESDLPDYAFSVLPCSRETGELLVTSPDINLLTFTGSPHVGWGMKERAGKKKVVLELGGNAGVIVDDSADLDLAVERCLIGGFAYSGQVCIHAQRIVVHKKLYSAFIEKFNSKVLKLQKGNPLSDETEIAEMIDSENAERVMNWLEEAKKDGAEIMTGGRRSGNFVEPTVVQKTNRSMKIYSEEVFGPVVIVEEMDSFEDGIRIINDSKFGLQAGVFVNDQNKMRLAFNELHVGGVIINDVPTFRVDHMPYGGIKESGLGREGIKYAIHDMLEPKILVW